jgi:hypothetical protein
MSNKHNGTSFSPLSAVYILQSKCKTFKVPIIKLYYRVMCNTAYAYLSENTGEELLHEGWGSYDNLFGVLMINVA